MAAASTQAQTCLYFRMQCRNVFTLRRDREVAQGEGAALGCSVVLPVPAAPAGWQPRGARRALACQPFSAGPGSSLASGGSRGCGRCALEQTCLRWEAETSSFEEVLILQTDRGQPAPSWSPILLHLCFMPCPLSAPGTSSTDPPSV